MDNVTSIEDFFKAKELPQNNRRLRAKIKDIERLKKHVKSGDSTVLVIMPLEGSSSLGLYNALIESLELDSRRIMKIIEGKV